MSNKMIYVFEVVESRAVTCRYEVEAASLSEAEALAEIGDTTNETYLAAEVVNREIVRRLKE